MYANRRISTRVAVALNCLEGWCTAAGRCRSPGGGAARNARWSVHEDAKRMHDDGMSVKEIGDKAGCSTASSMTAPRSRRQVRRSPLRPDQLDPDQAPVTSPRLLLQLPQSTRPHTDEPGQPIGCTRNYLFHAGKRRSRQASSDADAPSHRISNPGRRVRPHARPARPRACVSTTTTPHPADTDENLTYSGQATSHGRAGRA